MVDPVSVLKAVPAEVAKEVYSDAVGGALREVGKMGVDAVKTIRLALFPLQFTAAFQDRVASYINAAIRKVPAESRIAPVESLVLPIAEKLRYQDEGSVLTEMYVELLARAMDRERVGEAHPAFVHLIGQLAPDEAAFIEQLAVRNPSAYILVNASPSKLLDAVERVRVVSVSQLSGADQLFLNGCWLQPEALAQPTLFTTYLEHLVSLGLVRYTNRYDNFEHDSLEGHRYWFVELTEFGRLFHRACLKRES